MILRRFDAGVPERGDHLPVLLLEERLYCDREHCILTGMKRGDESLPSTSLAVSDWGGIDGLR